MRIGECIYNVDGQPFHTVDHAERMRDLLENETSRHYLVETCPGGYRVQREQTPIMAVEQMGETTADTNTGASVPPDNPTLKEYALRPAVFRTNLPALLLMGMAMALVLMPDHFISVLLAMFHSRPETIGVWWIRSQAGLTLLGGGVLVIVWLSLLWQRANALYRVTGFGVEARIGMFANQTIGLRYQDIRSMTVKQSLTDRLLGVGLLEFTSAGSDGMPVQFNRIAHPDEVLKVVKDRMKHLSSTD